MRISPYRGLSMEMNNNDNYQYFKEYKLSQDLNNLNKEEYESAINTLNKELQLE